MILEHFFDMIDTYQKLEFLDEISRQYREDVSPWIGDEKRIDFIHFMSINDHCSGQKIHLSANTHYYREQSDVMVRNISDVRIYENEFMMEFYMALHELKNQIDQNVMLFN